MNGVLIIINLHLTHTLVQVLIFVFWELLNIKIHLVLQQDGISIILTISKQICKTFIINIELQYQLVNLMTKLLTK